LVIYIAMLESLNYYHVVFPCYRHPESVIRY